MKFSRFLSVKAATAAGLVLAALGGASVAQARDNVYWSLGVQAAPGVTVGLGNTRPVYVAPQPVYLAPQQVYVQPQPVYVQAPQVVYQQAPVYVQQQPVFQAGYYYQQPYGHWRHGHHGHHGRH